MSEIPRFGQRSTSPRQEMCPKHPGRPAVAFCKRCNRPTCQDCTIPTEVGSVCVDCAGPGAKQRLRRVSLAGTQFAGAPVTLALVIINVVMFVVQEVWSGAFQVLAMSPLAAYMEPWRLLTTTFLHSGMWHILFNMLMLYILGSAVERAVGHWKFASIYLFSALVGSMAIIAWVFVSPETITQATIGASGAIYGLFGAVFIAHRRSGMSTSGILVLLGINLAYALIVPGISWQAHIGGFLGGLLATAVYMWVVDLTWGPKRSQRTLWEVVATIGLFGAFAIGTWGMYAVLIPSLLG